MFASISLDRLFLAGFLNIVGKNMRIIMREICNFRRMWGKGGTFGVKDTIG